MKKIYSFLLMLALTCVSSVAWGQSYDVNITSDPENEYFSGEQLFDASEIATALGLADAAAVQALIETNAAVYIKTGENDKSNAYSDPVEAPNVFWMNNQGVVQTYGDEGTCWYVEMYYNDGEENPEDKDKVGVSLGQMPGFFNKVYTDSDLSCILYLVNGDKTLTFNVNLHVNAAPEPIEVKLSELEIVKDYTLPLNFVLGKSYEGKAYSATLEGVYEALGTTAEEFDSKASAQTYTQTYININAGDTEKDAEYELIDSLSHPEDAAGGAWFGRYENFDEVTGNPIPLEINAPKEWAAGCTFYTQEIALAEGEYSIVSGQFPGTFTSVEDADYTYLYLVNGTKAVRIKVQVAMEEAQNIDPSEWEEVGEITINQTATKLQDYHTIASDITNIDEIATALGVEPEDIVYYHLGTSDGFDDSIDDTGINGAWLDENGHKCSWGANAAVMVCYALNDGVYQISSLQIPAGMSEKLYDGVNLSYPVFLVNEAAGKYYKVNFNYTVTLPEIEIKQTDWTQEGRLEYNVQLIPSADYLLDQNTTVDVDYITDKLGVEDINILTLYGDVYYADEEESDPEKKYTSQLTLTPEGGFWMKSVDGILYPTSFGEADAMGMDWQNSGTGIISWYNKPNTRSVGDTYRGSFYIVNEETGKYVRIVCNIEFVDELGPEQEPVGEQDVFITISEDNVNSDGLPLSDAVNWEDVYAKLNISADDIETSMWMLQNRSGKFVNFGGTDLFYGEDPTLDKDGYYVDLENGGNESDITFAIAFDLPTKKFTFSSMGEDVEDGTIYATKVALKSDTGYYVFNITAGTENTLTGINGVAAAKAKAGKIYDISGREVTAPVKGLYIQDGKKYIVK